MPSVQVHVEGLREVRLALNKTDNAIGPAIKAANLSAAKIVVADALPHVPYKTGRLRRATRALASQTAGKARSGNNTLVPYAAAIHWGRKRGNVGSPPGNHPGRNLITGRPYLRDAAERMRVRVRDSYEHDIHELLTKHKMD